MKTALAIAIGFLVLSAQHAVAARGSAKYSVPAEAIDAGGRHASSVKYTNDGSIGSPGGVSTATTPAETAKNGYIGQLYEVTGLIIGAATTNVPSGSNLQLNATARVDDGSFIALRATQVVWSVVSGPITAINTNGLATAGVIAQDTAATVRGDSLAQSGTLLLMVIAPGAKSSPYIVSFVITPTAFSASGTNGTAGANYYVLTSTNVALPLSNWTRLSTNTFDGAGHFSFTNAVAPGPPQRFYLLQVP
jgi:hypothetical protein